jgi:hypothetical protein
MGMPWIKLYSDFLDDPKVGFLSDAAQLLFVKLVLLAGECDAEGYIANGETGLTSAQVAWRLRMPLPSFRESLSELERAGLVQDGDMILVVNFQKRQDRSQSEKREMWRERKRRQRDSENVTRESPVTPASVPPLEREGERDQSRGEGEENASAQPTEPAPAPKKEPKAQPIPIPAAVKEYRRACSLYPAKSWYDKIAFLVGELPENLDQWYRTCYAWVGMGWKPTNVQGMLECFKRKEIPGDKRGPPGSNGGQTAVEGMLALAEQHKRERMEAEHGNP